MRHFTKALLFSAAGLAFAATSASAAIVCNADGDCWHVKERREYKPELGLKIYPDNWKWHQAESHRYRWREHAGHGYWRGGVWVDL